MKITEIFDVQNSNSNLILSPNTYFLITDYEDCKNRLQDHSATLELLTQRALRLSLFRGFPQKLKISKPSYLKKNDKPKNQAVANSELLVIRRLLLVNLRSFKIMQKLFHENKELQLLLNDSRAIAKKQKERIDYVKNENEHLKTSETRLKKRLGSLFRQLNQVSKSFIAGFKDEYRDDCHEKVSPTDDDTQCNSQKLELAFDFSTNVAYRLQDDTKKFLKINRIHRESSFNYDVDDSLKDFKIRLVPIGSQLPLNNYFSNSFEHIYRNRECKYPLLTWQAPKSIEHQNTNTGSKKSPPILKKCPYKIEKDIQNAIRLHHVNSSIWKSFLLMKTIREFIMFHQVCELMRAFLTAGGACANEQMSYETDQTILFRSKKFNSFASETASDCASQRSSTIKETTDEFLSKRNRGYPRKCLRKKKALYRLKKVPKKTSSRVSNNNKSKRRNSYISIRESTSIGVGDSYVALVDQESQVDDHDFIEPTIETVFRGSYYCLENDELHEQEFSPEISNVGRRDFKKSLQSLEKVIKSCQRNSEQENVTELENKLQRNKLKNVEKIVNPQYLRANTKVKEVKSKKRSSFDLYKKQTRIYAQLPEMSKMYQITLDNHLPRGVSFEYINPDKSKVQLLFVNNSRDVKMM